MSRRHDPRRSKPHRQYSTQDIMCLFRVSAGTVSKWRRDGLTRIPGFRPYVYAGAHLREFLTGRLKPRMPTGPGELYCVACKQVRRPENNSVFLIPRCQYAADLCGICPVCSRKMRQAVRYDSLGVKLGHLKLQHEGVPVPIGGDREAPQTAILEEV